MTQRQVEFIISARENLSALTAQISTSVAALGAQSGTTFTRMTRDLAGAQVAITKAATAMQQYSTATTQSTRAGEQLRQEAIRTAAAQQQLAAATARTTTEQNRAAQSAIALAAAQRKQNGGGNTSSGGGDEGPSLGRLAGALGIATGAVAIVKEVGGAILDMGKNAVTAAAQMETTRVAFTQFLGSAQAAKSFLAELQQFANSTPFEFPTLADASQRLLAVGVNAKAIIPIMTSIGDSVAAFGGSAATIDRVTLAFTQMLSKGKAGGDDLRQLAEANIPVWQILAESLHVTAAQAQQMSSAGEISAQQFIDGFQKYSSTHFAGMMERQSGTFAGLMSSLNDIGNTIAQTFGGPIIEAIEPRLQAIVKWLTLPEVSATLTEWADKIGRLAESIMRSLEADVQFARQMATELKPVIDVIAASLDTLPGKITASTVASDALAGALKQAANASAALTQAQAAYDATLSEKVTVQERSAAIAKALTAEEAGIRAAAEATGRAYDAQIQGQQDRVAALRSAGQVAQQGYDAQIAALRGAGTELDRNYAKLQRQWALEHLDTDIARNRDLAKNIFSSAGRAAAEALPDQELQRNHLILEQQHAVAKEQNEDRIAGVEREKQASNQAYAAQEAAIARHITDLERSKQAASARAQAEERGIQTTIAALQAQAAQETADAARVKAQTQAQMALDKAKTAAQVAGAVAYKEQVIAGLGQIRAMWATAAPKIQTDAEKIADGFNKVGDALTNVITLGPKAGAALHNLIKNATPAGSTSNDTNIDRTRMMDDAVRNLVITPEQATEAAQAAATQDTQTTAAAARRRREERADYVDGTRAGGGPVLPGGRYLVGENGPELLQMGRMGGMIAPTPFGGDAGLTVTHLCPSCLQTQIETTIDRSGPRLNRVLGNLWGGA